MRRTEHINIPVFVPHLGCPHNCVFCNQHEITECEEFDINSIDDTVGSFLTTEHPDASGIQIAFFGGSFTGIDRTLMIRILEKAYRYISDGKVSSIRVSTRPDYIDEEVLSVLKRFRVRTIELGIQSMSDKVLLASGRGHTALQTENAASLIKSQGFEFVGQMMIGLPCSAPDDEMYTAAKICEMGADAARVYPTVVFSNTALHRLAQTGVYTPLTTEEAAKRSAKVLRIFYKNNVDVIRIGLCETETLRNDTGATGAYHPALGELCINEYYRVIIEESLKRINISDDSDITVYCSNGSLSKVIGQKKRNRKWIEDNYPVRSLQFKESEEVKDKDIKISVKENANAPTVT